MKQYCRYCANCIVGDVVYCEVKDTVMSESTAKVVNNCKHFIFNEMDVFDLDKTYKPKTQKALYKGDNENQFKLF